MSESDPLAAVQARFVQARRNDAESLDLAVQIAAAGRAGIAFLRLHAADERYRRASVYALARCGEPGQLTVPELEAYLCADDELVVADAIDALGDRSVTATAGKIAALAADPSPYVRGSVLRYLRSTRPEAAFDALVERIADDSFIVRENVADELGELGDDRAVPYLETLLGDEHEAVREAARTALSYYSPRPSEGSRHDEGR